MANFFMANTHDASHGLANGRGDMIRGDGPGLCSGRWSGDLLRKHTPEKRYGKTLRKNGALFPEKRSIYPENAPEKRSIIPEIRSGKTVRYSRKTDHVSGKTLWENAPFSGNTLWKNVPFSGILLRKNAMCPGKTLWKNVPLFRKYAPEKQSIYPEKRSGKTERYSRKNAPEKRSGTCSFRTGICPPTSLPP